MPAANRTRGQKIAQHAGAANGRSRCSSSIRRITRRSSGETDAACIDHARLMFKPSLAGNREIVVLSIIALRSALWSKRGQAYIFFSRKHGDVYKPFYVGETTSVKGRLKAHWHTANIQFVLRGIGDGLLKEIKGGERYFHCGYLISNTTKPKRYLVIGQKYLIRQVIVAGCTLINKNLTKISMDTLEFRGSVAGRAIYPKQGEIEA